MDVQMNNNKNSNRKMYGIIAVVLGIKQSPYNPSQSKMLKIDAT